MKKIIGSISVMALLFLTACSNDSNTYKASILRLENEVDDGHIVGMSKMGKLTRLQQRTSYLIDSLNKVPANAQASAAPYKARLEDLLKDLNYADFAMNKWMEEFYTKDSTVITPKERVGFLQAEKEKVTKVKEAILGSLQKADSLFSNP